MREFLLALSAVVAGVSLLLVLMPWLILFTQSRMDKVLERYFEYIDWCEDICWKFRRK